MNVKLGVRHSIFTVFVPGGGTRKWNRAHRTRVLLGTAAAGFPPCVVLTTALSTTPSDGVGTVNFAVSFPTFRR